MDQATKEALTSFTLFARQIQSNPKLLPLYGLLGLKGLAIAVDSAKKIGEATQSVKEQFTYAGCKIRTVSYASIFTSLLLVDKSDAKLRIVSQEEFEKCRSTSEYFSKNATLAVDFFPMEYVVSRQSLPSGFSGVFSGSNGVYSCELRCSKAQYANREVEVKMISKAESKTPSISFNLKF